MEKDKLEKLKELLKVANDGLSKAEFLKHFRNAIKMIVNIEKQLIAKIDKAIDTMKSDLIVLKSATQSDLNDLKAKHKERVDKALKEQENGLNFIRDKVRSIKSGINGKNGIDGINGVDGVNGNDGSQDTPEQVRNKIETLMGEERFDLSAIKGLRRILTKLEDRPLGKGGGGFSLMHLNIHILDPYAPTGSVNGSNKDFVLSNVPNPSASLKVYVNGMKMQLTGDYTISNKTISMITAPPTGSIIEVEHRK